MLKIKSGASVTLSFVFTSLLTAVVTAVCVRLPDLLFFYLLLFNKDESLFVPTLILIYFSALLAYCFIACLFVLLMQIKRNDVFTSKSVSCLRAMSWLCFGASAVYAALTFHFTVIGGFVAFVCAFIGVMLRVVKNAFENAVELKNENDFTV